jgi:fructokinase
MRCALTVYGGIETGGSKWECAIGTGPDDLRATETIRTTTPQETIERAIAFFERGESVKSIGIGSFGPIDHKPASQTWGHITTTPKPAGRTPTSDRRSGAASRCRSHSTPT